MKPTYSLLLIVYTGYLFDVEQQFYALAVSGDSEDEIRRIIDRGHATEKQGLISLIDESLQNQNLTVISNPIPKALYCVTDWDGSVLAALPTVDEPNPNVELRMNMKAICVFEKRTGRMILVESA